jgi:nucleobase transporter 1/2
MVSYSRGLGHEYVARLPIVQGGSFNFLPPTFSIIFNAQLQAIEDEKERFETTMQVVSGALVVYGLVQAILGYSGAIVPLLKYITPVTIAPVITVIGLSLFILAGLTNLSTWYVDRIDVFAFYSNFWL